MECAEPGRFLARVGHLTACALWRPAYRAELAGGALRLESDAVVWQRTGEDWSGVRLTLSTARSASAGEPCGAGRGPAGAARAVGAGEEDRRGGAARAGGRRRGPAGAGPAGGGRRRRGAGAAGGRAGVGALGRAGAPGAGERVRGGGAQRVRGGAGAVGDGDRGGVVPQRVGARAAGGPGRPGPRFGPHRPGALEFAAPGAPVRLAFGSSDGLRVVREADERREGAAWLTSAPW